MRDHAAAHLDWRLTAAQAVARWPRELPLLALISGRYDPRWATRSIFATPAGKSSRNLFSLKADQGAPCRVASDPLDNLRRRVASDPAAMWIGYLAYDLGRWIESIPTLAADDRGWPIVQMHRCPGWLELHHATQRWSAHGMWSRGGYPSLDRLGKKDHAFTAGDPVSHVTCGEYEAAVADVIARIGRGDVFQVNLSQRFTAPFTGSPRGVTLALLRHTPAWYAAHLELTPPESGPRDTMPHRSLLSASPELFLRLEGDGLVTTRPIKGTRPAWADAAELADSAKDAAELAMIVDLLRNDLGRVCCFGSIAVPEARALETHPTIHHTAATVTGRLAPDRDLYDLLRATMPGGSITGAPKVMAMHIIEELEPARRGPYCGAIGYIQGDTAQFNIAIRTLQIEHEAWVGNGRLDYGVGGGIVADSAPAAEYEETLHKAAGMRAALAKPTRST